MWEVIKALVEDNSIRATCRLTDIAKVTVTRLLRDVGKTYAKYQDKTLHNLPCKYIQCNERQNLTMRTSMRRFTRLSNAFSKKIENAEYAVALHFMYYNIARPHKTLTNPCPKTPAIAAGISNHIGTIEEIVSLAINY